MGDVKKKIKPGQMELHPEELAIVVNYEVQEIQTQPDGTQQLLNREQTNKKITVKSLNESSNVAQLAQEIVDKCK
ncbi:uncharacterized protein HaLaN_04424, partial [Haematococcus lacustris]